MQVKTYAQTEYTEERLTCTFLSHTETCMLLGSNVCQKCFFWHLYTVYPQTKNKKTSESKSNVLKGLTIIFQSLFYQQKMDFKPALTGHLG